MSFSDDEAVLRRWAQAINERDVETALSIAADDIDLVPIQVGVTGTYKGHDGVARWLREVTDLDPGHHVEVERIRTRGDGNAALFGTLLSASGEALSPYTLIATIREGKIVAVRSYLSDEETLKTIGIFGR